MQGLGRRIPFAFLDDIKDRFVATYGSSGVNQAIAYEFNTEFSQVLQQRMQYFANDPNADAINRVRGGVAEVKNIMVENIEKVILLTTISCCTVRPTAAQLINKVGKA